MQLEAHAKHDKAVLILGIVWIKESDRVLIKKYSLSLLKRDAMLLDVLLALGFIPFELQLIHMYSVRSDGD